MQSLAAIDPFYAACLSLAASSVQAEPSKPIYARLPLAPVTASPVPHLTSLYHFHRAGDYGDRSYPGNCGGNLIKDLLRYFQPQNVFDPMTGSGTCRDVCQELGIACTSSDIHHGFDLCDPHEFFGKAADVVVTLEDHALMGGYGSAVLELFSEKSVTTPMVRIGWADNFIEHAEVRVFNGGEKTANQGFVRFDWRFGFHRSSEHGV